MGTKISIILLNTNHKEGIKLGTDLHDFLDKMGLESQFFMFAEEIGEV
jgi:hypothetical protein